MTSAAVASLPADLRSAIYELQALAALIERPPLDDVLLTQSVALRSAGAMRTVLAALVSAPAWDAVEALKHSPAIEELTPGQDEWLRCSSIQDRYDLMKRRVDRAAALARPRATVGDDDVGLVEAARDLLEAHKRLNDAVRYRFDLWECLEANLNRLAPQSERAKTEARHG